MKFERLRIPDVLLLTPQIFSDHRGRFLETFRIGDLVEASNMRSAPAVIQGNLSNSVPWTLRGLHYQQPHPQGKLVRVVRGKIQDIAVDLRKDSPTYGQHVSALLDSVEGKAIWVPPGFAHGFLALDNGADVYYECTNAYYSDEFAKDLKYDDTDLGINWMIPPGRTPVVSQKDRKAAAFREITPLEL